MNDLILFQDGARLNPSAGIAFTDDRTAVNIASAKLSDQARFRSSDFFSHFRKL